MHCKFWSSKICFYLTCDKNHYFLAIFIFGTNVISKYFKGWVGVPTRNPELRNLILTISRTKTMAHSRLFRLNTKIPFIFQINFYYKKSRIFYLDMKVVSSFLTPSDSWKKIASNQLVTFFHWLCNLFIQFHTFVF